MWWRLTARSLSFAVVSCSSFPSVAGSLILKLCHFVASFRTLIG